MSDELSEFDRLLLTIARQGTDSEKAVIWRGLMRMINLRLNAVPEDAANALRAINIRVQKLSR